MVLVDVASYGLCYYSISQNAFDIFKYKGKMLNIFVFY